MLDKLVAEKIREEFNELCAGASNCFNCKYACSSECSGEIRFTIDNYERIREEVINNLPFVERIKVNDTYYYLNSRLEVIEDRFENWIMDKNRIEIGNFFETQQEAEAKIEALTKAFKGQN